MLRTSSSTISGVNFTTTFFTESCNRLELMSRLQLGNNLAKRVEHP